MSTWIEHKLIKPASIEKREYQVRLAEAAMNANTLIVLPTGLGKTTIALLIIADMLSRSNKRCLLMAPTRVLVHQHYSFLKAHLKIIDIAVLTGEDPIPKRREIWNNSVICATPQVVENDLERLIIKPEDLSLIIFDEAHRAIGDHAYCNIAALMKGKVKLVGLTATIPSEYAKAEEVVRNLGIEHIEYRDENSNDVKPYIHETKIEWVNVEMPQLMRHIRSNILEALNRRIDGLKRRGIVRGSTVSELIRVKDSHIIREDHEAARTLFSAIRLSHALNILDTQSIEAFVRFCERLRERKGFGVYTIFSDKNFSNAYEMARGALISGIEHPKLEKLCSILSETTGKVMVFTSYRDSVEIIYNKLREKGLEADYLIGKAGEDGLKQSAQIDAVNRFRSGEVRILVATRVGEEGLDISECNLVVFYDNVPSAIRFIQRKGRTGRKAAGRVLVLVTKDTIDEAYYWISKRKIREVENVVNRMNYALAKRRKTSNVNMSLDSF